jgi:hypothetical protein
MFIQRDKVQLGRREHAAKLQSWIDPGAAVGGEGCRGGVVAGVADVAGGTGERAGILDTALGGDSELIDGLSTGLSSLCGGLSRGNGGLPGDE